MDSKLASKVSTGLTREFSFARTGGIVMLGTALLLGACSSDDDNDDSSPTTELPDTAALTATDLEGSWSTGCILDDANDVSDGYEIETITFTADAFTASAASYSDADCSTVVADDDDIELSGSYVLHSAVLTSQGLEATEIDFSADISNATDGSVTTGTLLDLVHSNGDTLYLGEGDFDDIRDPVAEPRPGTIDLEDSYLRQP